MHSLTSLFGGGKLAKGLEGEVFFLLNAALLQDFPSVLSPELQFRHTERPHRWMSPRSLHFHQSSLPPHLSRFEHILQLLQSRRRASLRDVRLFFL